MKSLVKLLFVFSIVFSILSFASCATCKDLKKSSYPLSNGTLNVNGKTAVVYFSATGNTRAVAKTISDYLKSDLIEIIPEIEYTTEDLTYRNSASRSSVENADDNSRPKIKNNIDIRVYDNVFICYPIWFAKAPKILWTFVDGRDFSGKTIYPVCTSGTSGPGESSIKLQSLAKGGVWKDCIRFSGSVEQDKVIKYLNELNILQIEVIYE